MNKRKLGSVWEDEACRFLQENGVLIRHRNIKLYRGGEIDIVGMDMERILIFAEVKYRRNTECGYPQEAVDPVKIHNICRCADFYRMRYAFPDSQQCRFDVIAITGEGHHEISWFKNAFDYVGRG